MTETMRKLKGDGSENHLNNKSGSILFDEEVQKSINVINEEMQKIPELIPTIRSVEELKKIIEKCDTAQALIVDLILKLTKENATAEEVTYLQSKVRDIERLKILIRKKIKMIKNSNIAPSATL